MTLQALLDSCLGDRDPVALARDQAGEWTAWVVSIDPPARGDQDSASDDEFQALRDEVNKLSGMDIPQVLQLAKTLLAQPRKDLRVATYYLWARLHRDGAAGLAEGLCLIAALLETHGNKLLPTRAASRTLALEWLTSAKVLDGLSQHPHVAAVDAERIVAALAWLDEALQPWPEAQRPDLTALYRSLGARLGSNSDSPDSSNSNSLPTQIPTQSATADAGGPATIRSAREMLDSTRALVGYVREQPQGWLAAHRIMKSLRWDTLHQLPSQSPSGTTQLAPPRSEYRARLARLHQQQAWSEVLLQVEQIFAEGANHFWLDLQWHLYQALRQQPAPLDSWAQIIKRDLDILLQRLPGLEHLQWNDGSPFADQATREWMAEQLPSHPTQQPLSACLLRAAPADEDVFALEDHAQALAHRESVDAALAWLAAQPATVDTRQRWLLRLVMARVAERHGKSTLALHLLGELDTRVQQHGLAHWEPQLSFEVKARLLRLLQRKAKHGPTERPALASRMDTLLAALVAIDPVRAAGLCG